MEITKTRDMDNLAQWDAAHEVPGHHDDWEYRDYWYELQYLIHGVARSDNDVHPVGYAWHPLVPVDTPDVSDTYPVSPQESVEELKSVLYDDDRSFIDHIPEDARDRIEIDEDAQETYYERSIRMLNALDTDMLAEVRRYNSADSVRTGKNDGVTIAVWDISPHMSAVVVRETTRGTWTLNTEFYVEFTCAPENTIEAACEEHPNIGERKPVVPVMADAAKPVYNTD